MSERTWSYDRGGVPEGYRCSSCGEHGVRLYRQWNTIVEHIKLLCTACGLQDQHRGAPDAPNGHNIGYLAAAVPCEDIDTYWSYTAVPAKAVTWWEALPVRQSTTTEPKLKPCPFCGSVDVAITETIGCDYVECANCGARGPEMVEATDAAGIAWNERAEG